MDIRINKSYRLKERINITKYYYSDFYKYYCRIKPVTLTRIKRNSMDNSIALLSVTAVSLGFIHTLLGPDHYLPFIVLSEAKKWTIKKTMLITLLCGMGHVLVQW